MTRPSGRRPRRGHTPRRERRVIRVLTEGKVTEPSYLTAWARRYRHSVSLSLPESGMAPETLINHASQHIRRRRRSKRSEQDFDEIWCVFDIDHTRTYRLPYTTHGKVASRLRVSNPCMELWLVLHAEDQTAHINRRNVQRPANELQLTSGKRIPDTAWSSLFDEFETARRRAKALYERHAGNGSPPRSNPSTDIWRLVDQIRHDQP
ncbi:MAG: RloB family protein [Spirochaetaceae bacterium]|nr:RloB family protein [Spirochaetaceae bacterium]